MPIRIAPAARDSRAFSCLQALLLLSFLCSPPVLAQADRVFANGFDPLPAAPQIRVLRDDRVATVEMDYNADSPWGQFWDMTGSPDDDAGFLVVWWPQATAGVEETRLITGNDSGGGCLNPDHLVEPLLGQELLDLPPGAKWLVTGNRRVQLQPLLNNTSYHLRVQRISARGAITTQAAELAFNGGDPTRVDALRASLTYFDDFNLPLGAADEKLWNNAHATPTDPRYNLFFINDQYHAHTINGTRTGAGGDGDKSQTAQRFRKQIRIEEGVRRRIVFDMDSPLSPRSVWYLDLNPIPADLSGHASFFDEEGELGLPAGVLRLRAQGQSLSLNLIDMQGASRRLGGVDLEQTGIGRQAVSNVRRNFDLRVGTDGVEVFVDGKRVLNPSFAPHSLAAGDYELLWLGVGYNTSKDAVPYYLLHWDNFGFDGPVVDPRTTHNYVTRIAGTDFQKSTRWNASYPTFTVKVPDNLRPTTAGASAEVWLVYTYQMGDSSNFQVLPSDHVIVNGAAQFTLPQPRNNTVPLNPAMTSWRLPHTARIKLGDATNGGSSPLLVGDNTFRFFAESSGIVNVHVEVLYQPGSAPAYTPPSAIHHFPLHAELPWLGPPARLQSIDGIDVGEGQHITAANVVRIPVSGLVPLNIEIGNRSWAGWAPQLMHMPVQSTEVWSTGGTAGIARVEVFLRRVGTGSGPGPRILLLDTALDAPAPQGRYRLQFDSRDHANGNYELFVEATTPSGLKSHPSYGDEAYHFAAETLSGAYYPIPITIQN